MRKGSGWDDSNNWPAEWGDPTAVAPQRSANLERGPPWVTDQPPPPRGGGGGSGRGSADGPPGVWVPKGSTKSMAMPKYGGSNPHKLFVGNLTAEATTDHVWQALKPAGEIVGVRVLEGKFSGIAFVEFKDPMSVERAVRTLQSVDICGRPARLEPQGRAGVSAVPVAGGVCGTLAPRSAGSVAMAGMAATGGCDGALASMSCIADMEADPGSSDWHDAAAGGAGAGNCVIMPGYEGAADDADVAGGGVVVHAAHPGVEVVSRMPNVQPQFAM